MAQSVEEITNDSQKNKEPAFFLFPQTSWAAQVRLIHQAACSHGSH